MDKPESLAARPEIMGPERRRRWSCEQRAAIVSEIDEPCVSVSEVARRYAIAPSQLFQCRKLAEGGALEVTDPRLRGCAVGDSRAREQESDRSSGSVAQGVDLGAASGAGSPDGLAPLPPFPATAERCARTAERSISPSAGGSPT